MVRGRLNAILEQVLDYFGEKDESSWIEVLGVRSEHGSWKCRFCGRDRIQKKYPDLYRHIWGNHYGVVEEETSENERATVSHDHDEFSVGDYVEDYSLDRPESDTEEVNIQDPSGSSNSSKLNHLMIYYRRITQGIEENGSFHINSRTHIGSARGGHIKQNFKMAVRRIEDDSLENYQIENDGGGDYPIIIERRN